MSEGFHEIKRGIDMTIAPVAALFLGNYVADLVLGSGVVWAEMLVGLLIICGCFLGAWSFFIGLIHLVGGVFVVLRQLYLARTPDA